MDSKNVTRFSYLWTALKFQEHYQISSIQNFSTFYVTLEPLKRFWRKWKCNFLVRWPNSLCWCPILSFFQRDKLSALGLPRQRSKGVNKHNDYYFISYWCILLRNVYCKVWYISVHTVSNLDGLSKQFKVSNCAILVIFSRSVSIIPLGINHLK